MMKVILLGLILCMVLNFCTCAKETTFEKINNTSTAADSESDKTDLSLRSDTEFEGLESGLPLEEVKDFDPSGDYSWLDRDDLPDRSFHETSDGHFVILSYFNDVIASVSISELAESVYKSPKENRYIFSDELNLIDEQYSSAQTLQLSRSEYYDALIICRDEWKSLIEKYTALILASEDHFALPHRDLKGSVYLETFSKNCSQWEVYAHEKIAMYEQLYPTLYDTGTIVPELVVEVECEVYRDRAIELYLICRDANIST